MSMTARHEDRKARRMCQGCRDRKARFQYRGHVRADRVHPPSLPELRRASTLCFECYRSERERMRAQRLGEVRPVSIRSPFPGALTERQVQHRLAMLEFASALTGDQTSRTTMALDAASALAAADGSRASAARNMTMTTKAR